MLNNDIKVDLHLHTTHSDGRLSATDLLTSLADKGLEYVSITDHDSTDGLDSSFDLCRSFANLSLIAGIELSTDIPGNEIHVLGYFIRYSDLGFQKTLADFRDGRVDRAKEMVDKLARLGLPVEWERVLELAQGTVGRPHIAQAMVENGYITYPQEAFDKYIGRNGLAYAERPKLTPEESVQLITSVGGVAVLAHPREVDNVTALLPSLKEAGLVGMEVYYGGYDASEVRYLLGISEGLGLIPCGGSDYHAFGTPGEIQPGSVGPPLHTVRELSELAGIKIN